MSNSECPNFPFGPIPHWVNVDDKKPEPYIPVLLCGKEWIGYGVYRSDGDYFSMHPIIGNVEKKGLVTHWQPLPKPPLMTDETNPKTLDWNQFSYDCLKCSLEIFQDKELGVAEYRYARETAIEAIEYLYKVRTDTLNES